MGDVSSYQLHSHKDKGLLVEPLGSLAFKMVQVRQLESGQRVKLESAAGRCVFVKGQRFPCHS
ncbi:hypothetical protein F511_39703 [Dorcoceras hygrometricum]|uniref:Uncharacterized protein n=1 Tax=Dorcoceras hygrometricum TaxID=472368 RepID=A0A2Z7DG73_9LAMI|nr:hypothetical protein F511_39703 [Dorcoceras hygrometricum]